MKRRKDQDEGVGAVTPDHDGEIVELTRVASIAEAIAIKQDLERIGVTATVFESDAGGWAPHFAIGQGHRVMVRAGDLDRARQILSSVGGQLSVDESPPARTVRKHLRHHEDASPDN